MQALWLVALLLWLAGCTTLERAAHVHGGNASAPSTFTFRNGQPGVYYQFRINADADKPDAGPPDVALFLLGGSGCASWKSVMPGYVQGFARPAHVFALNKRHIEDRSLGILPCSFMFHAHNNMDHWVRDYTDIMRATLDRLPVRPRHVVLVGVSEGALPASMIAATSGIVTHLGVLAFGGWSIMHSLEDLYDGRPGEMDPQDIRKAFARAPDSLTDEVYGHPYRWWRDVSGVDPMRWLKGLSIPVIIGMGAEDINVSPASATDIQTQFKALGKTNAQVMLYPGANHRLAASGKSYRDDYFGALARAIRD